MEGIYNETTARSNLAYTSAAKMPTTIVSLDSDEELQAIADVLGKSKKVVVITGAGISTNCGIPVS